MFKPLKHRNSKSNPDIVSMWPYDGKKYNENIKISNTKIRGYYIFCDNKHPLAYKSTGHVYLHRHVASLKIGRWVTTYDIVHHINGDKLDNHPDNLHVINRREHIKEHKHGGSKTK